MLFLALEGKLLHGKGEITVRAMNQTLAVNSAMTVIKSVLTK